VYLFFWFWFLLFVMLNSSCCKVNFLFESRIEDPLENEMAHLKGLFLFNKYVKYFNIRDMFILY